MKKLLMAALLGVCVLQVMGDEVLVNGNFENGTWVANASPTGWTGIAYNHQNGSTETDLSYVESGDQAFRQNRIYSSSTMPVLYQNFDIGTSATEFTVSGYILLTEGAKGTIRIREQKTGSAGSVYFYSEESSSWELNTVAISNPTSYYQGNKWGSSTDYTEVFLDNAAEGETIGTYQYFSITIPKLNDVTAYALDLTDVVYVTTGSYDVWWDNMSVTAVPEPATMALLGIGGLVGILRKRSH